MSKQINMNYDEAEEAMKNGKHVRRWSQSVHMAIFRERIMIGHGHESDCISWTYPEGKEIVIGVYGCIMPPPISKDDKNANDWMIHAINCDANEGVI